MENEIKFISVQSRKGGVGKTTVAYNFARGFLKDKSKTAVLLIDLDFFGTDITVSTSFKDWFPDRHLVKYNFDYPSVDTTETIGIEGKKSITYTESVNLLKLFNDHYTDKQRLTGFTHISDETANHTSLVVDMQKVNLIGSSSQIVDEDNNILEQNPSVLFDPIVGYWFVRFVMQIANRFLDCANKNEYSAVIVFDNSPGHMGLVPMLEECLLDFGPNISKFVFVSSNQESDILESFYGINTLHAKLLYRMKSLTDDSELNDYQKHFLLRYSEYLRDVESSSKMSEDNPSMIEQLRYRYYTQFNDENPSRSVLSSDYMGIIINKVLPELFSGEHDFKIENLLVKTEAIWDLFSGGRHVSNSHELVVNSIRKFMVPKSEFFEWPYLGLQESKALNFSTKRIVKFDTPSTHFTFDDFSKVKHKSPIKLYLDSKLAIYRTANRYNVVIERMKSCKLGFIARQIPPTWGLSVAFDHFVSLFSEFSKIKRLKQWTLGVDPQGSTKAIDSELKKEDSIYKIADEDSFLSVTYKVLFSIVLDKFQLGEQTRARLDKMFERFYPIFDELGTKISYSDIQPIELYRETLRACDEYIKLTSEDYVMVGLEDFVDDLLNVLIRFMFCEQHLEQFSNLVVGIMKSFSNHRKISKNKISTYTLFLSSMYIHLGNSFIVEQSMGLPEFTDKLEELEDGTTEHWRMLEFESVISQIQRHWA